MARHIEDEVKYYYDSHPTEEDLMGETDYHRVVTEYLMNVLKWLFHERPCSIYANLNFYQTPNAKEYPLAPDIAIIPGIAHRLVRSWRIGKSGPAPQVVFEIASEETWHKDLDDKPLRYAHMGVGVQEYFAYDPNEPPLPRSGNRRLFGWQLDPHGQRMREIQPRPDGSLWSSCLESWLVPDGIWLRLYDRNGKLRLTHAEASDQRAQAFAEKLRSLGVDPDQILPDQLL